MLLRRGGAAGICKVPVRVLQSSPGEIGTRVCARGCPTRLLRRHDDGKRTPHRPRVNS